MKQIYRKPSAKYVVLAAESIMALSKDIPIVSGESGETVGTGDELTRQFNSPFGSDSSWD